MRGTQNRAPRATVPAPTARRGGAPTGGSTGRFFQEDAPAPQTDQHLNCKWVGPRHHATTFKSQVTRTVPAAFAAGVMELQNLSLQQVLQATEKEPALHVT